MRFVPIKTVEQQSVLMVHRTRQLFVRQRTSLINAIRAHLAEFGIVAGVGRNGVDKLLTLIAEGKDEHVPPEARSCLMALAGQLDLLKRQIQEADRRILAWHRSNSMSKRLEAIPGIGPLGASALVASIPDPHIFRSGRDVSAWIGRSTVRSRSPNKIPAVARNVSVRSQKRAIDTCASCWSSAPCP
jgi:transposase